MRRLSALLLLVSFDASAQLPERVTLDEALRIVSEGPRVAASQRDADAARADRDAAGRFANPSLSFGRSRPSGGERTIFDGDRQDQASLELPVPIFGQRSARVQVAERQVERAQWQVQSTLGEARKSAALGFVRLLVAQEQLALRLRARGEIERIRGIVSGRLDNGMASRYDLARADAELSLASVGVQKAQAEVAEQAAALAALAGAGGWRPQAQGALESLRPAPSVDADALLDRSPALQTARAETRAAEARIELAQRERFPVPSIGVGRTWTSGPFGAANFLGVSSEIPILDTRRAQEDKARAEAAAARSRERAIEAGLRAELQRHLEVLRARRAALERLRGSDGTFLEMAESAYRLGRATLFELLDARRTQLEAGDARLELLGAVAESGIEIEAISGSL
ncbi:MAG TPA: TolC family protein [Burkholderiales bacterium]|jgi:cobalt-zinc-cadmium efflux system outer membrane protein|nr:TolC family protein [Burkholderiales bacterium]